MTLPSEQPMTFDEELQRAVQRSVLDLVIKGNLVMPDYEHRAKVPAAKIQEIYDAIDWGRVKELVIKAAEERVADVILNSMATEIATDVKQVLSNKELREEVRAFVRSGIRRVAGAQQ